VFSHGLFGEPGLGGPSAKLAPHVTVSVERLGKVALSEWGVDLMERVDTCGSLAEDARQLGIPYRTARYKLYDMENALGGQLFIARSGGSSRGGTRLTERARDAVRRYRRLTAGLDESIADRFAETFADFN
jgi:molybdate transport system regulatory protein